MFASPSIFLYSPASSQMVGEVSVNTWIHKSDLTYLSDLSDLTYFILFLFSRGKEGVDLKQG